MAQNAQSPALAKLEKEFTKNGGQWREFKLENLFQIKTTKSIDKNKITFLNDGIYDFIGRSSVNNGIQGKVNHLGFEPNPKFTFSLVQVGESVCLFRASEWYASQNIFILNANQNTLTKNHNFITTAINRALQIYKEAYSYPTLQDVKDTKIQLPAHKNGEIAFDFMQSYIAELEAERIAELEAYLQATGLKDYELNEDEKAALKAFESLENLQNSHHENLKWREFKIEDLFEIFTGRDVIISRVKSGNIPLISHQNTNNGVAKYIEKLDNRIIFDYAKTISLADRGVFYASTQNQNFHIGTRVKALVFKDDKNITKNIRLFFVCAINKLQILFTEYSANATDKLPNLKIQLPTKNCEIDFDFMRVFIKAIEKEVIKGVVLYSTKRLTATKQIIQKPTPNNENKKAK